MQETVFLNAQEIFVTNSQMDRQDNTMVTHSVLDTDKDFPG